LGVDTLAKLVAIVRFRASPGTVESGAADEAVLNKVKKKLHKNPSVSDLGKIKLKINFVKA
jgi:hypothetical protein